MNPLKGKEVNHYRNPCIQFLWILILLLGGVSDLRAQTIKEREDVSRKDYQSDQGFIIGTYQPRLAVSEASRPDILANNFVMSLGDTERKLLLHPLDSNERQKWTNTPARGNVGGLALKNLSDEQTKKFCHLLASVTSKQGYQKITQIMLGDDLRSTEFGRPNPGVGIEAFRIVLFGTPNPKTQWGLQLDGHHIAFNVTLVGDKLTMSPSFFGTRPDTFRVANKKMTPLEKEVELAFQLVNSFSLKQKRKAILDETRGRILLGPGWKGTLPAKQGLLASEMNRQQRSLFEKLIDQWIGTLPEKHRIQRLKSIQKNWNQTYFSWNGETTAGSDISFAIFGPTLSIEFACQGRGGNPNEHLHSMYRDPSNDYGKKFLANPSGNTKTNRLPLKKRVDLSPKNSRIQFTGRHTGKKPRPRLGGFQEFSGFLEFDDQLQKPSTIHLDFDMTSVWTKFSSLTQHLKGSEFFDVKKYPRSVFKSSEIRKIKNNHYKVIGELQLHEKTKTISIDAHLETTAKYFSLRSRFQLDRTNFGLDQMTGGVDRWVDIEVNLGQPTVRKKSVKGNGSEGKQVNQTVKLLPGDKNMQAITLNLPGMT